MGTDDAADAGRLAASLVILNPEVGGHADVQSALTGLGGASVFPVGPKDDGTNTYVIAASANTMAESVAFNGTDGTAAMNLAISTADAATAGLLAAANSGKSARVECVTATATGRAHVDIDGATLIDALENKLGLYGATPVVQPTAITAPAGGAVIDVESRAAIVSILNALGAAGGGIGITA